MVLDELGEPPEEEEEAWETTEKEHSRKRTKGSQEILDEYQVGEHLSMLTSMGSVGEEDNSHRNENGNVCHQVEDRGLEEVTRENNSSTTITNTRLHKLWARFKAVDSERKELLARILEEETQNPSEPLFSSPEYISVLKGIG